MSTIDQNASDVDTRTKLVLAAELLFGERGIDAVPLRDVMAAAGQRNASALNYYHIGTREKLVSAIFDFRRSAVDARRMQLLDEYKNSCASLDENAIARALVLPLVELMLNDPTGGNYLRFLSQAFVTDRPENSYLSRGQFDHGTRLCLRIYRERHPKILPRILREHLYLCGRAAIYALADWQRDRSAGRSGFPRSNLPEFASTVVAVTASGLSAVSMATVP